MNERIDFSSVFQCLDKAILFRHHSENVQLLKEYLLDLLNRDQKFIAQVKKNIFIISNVNFFEKKYRYSKLKL